MEAKRMRLEGIAVLTIDDDQDSRTLLKTTLNQAGAAVIEATSGEEALEIFETVPDVVLTDLRMPEMDGYQLLERIRALEPDHGGLVPVIAVTAFQRLEDYSKALEPGFDFFLVKPVNPDELIRATADVLGKMPDV
jgi:CheY-like chemotaxis protein